MEEHRGKKEEREEQKGRNGALIGRILYLLSELSTTKVKKTRLPFLWSVAGWAGGLGCALRELARPDLMRASSPC